MSGVHITDPPLSVTYVIMFTRDSVRIEFLLAALNDSDILAGDNQNSYLNTLKKEKSFFYAGDEWKSD